MLRNRHKLGMPNLDPPAIGQLQRERVEGGFVQQISYILYVHSLNLSDCFNPFNRGFFSEQILCLAVGRVPPSAPRRAEDSLARPSGNISSSVR